MPISRIWWFILAAALLVILAVMVAWWSGIGRKPKATPVVWVNSWQNPPPQIQHFAFASAVLSHEIGVSVHVPTHTTPAPVIYFLHGRGGDETTDADAFMTLLQPILQRHQLPEPLVVFPNGGLSGYSGLMADMIINELVPYIDRRYGTRAAPRFRLLAGFSMGGNGAVRLAILRPEIFGGAASWGGGIWEDAALLQAATANTDIYRAQGFQFLLINGQKDRPAAFAALAEVLQHQGISHRREVLHDVGHNITQYFDHSVELYAEHLLTLWQ